MQKIINKVDLALSNKGKDRQEVIKTIGANDNVIDGDIQFFLADLIAQSVQYSNRSGLCKMAD